MAQRTKPLQPAAGVFLFFRDFLEIVFFSVSSLSPSRACDRRRGFRLLIIPGVSIAVFIRLPLAYSSSPVFLVGGEKLVAKKCERRWFGVVVFSLAWERKMFFFPPASGGGPGPLVVAAGGGVELHQVRPVFLLFRQGRKRRPRRRRRRQPEALEE